MKVKKSVLLVLLTSVGLVSYSQTREERDRKKEEREEKINQLIIQEEQGSIIFNRQTIFGLKLNTDGYGMFLEFARMKTARKSNLYSLELGERKHSKEEKVPSTQAFFLSNPYVYGKINNFYYAKFGYFQQRLIGNKGNKNGVAISANYGGGISAGMLKPYYLKVDDSRSSSVRDIKYSEENEDLFLNNPNAVLGATGFTKGFGEIKFTPGAFVKTALRFDYGRYNELVSALEVGLNVEFYAKKMPYILLQEDKQLYFNAYAAIAFGKRK